MSVRITDSVNVTDGVTIHPRHRITFRQSLEMEMWADLEINTSDGYVDRWYDVTGNDNGVEQTVLDDRPVYNASDSDFGIVNASVEKVEDQFMFNFGGDGKSLLAPNTSGTNPDLTWIIAGSVLDFGTGGGSIFLMRGDVGGNIPSYTFTSNTNDRHQIFTRDDSGNFANRFSNNNEGDTNPHIWIIRVTGTTATAYSDKNIIAGLNGVNVSLPDTRTLDTHRLFNSGQDNRIKVAAIAAYTSDIGESNAFVVSDEMNRLLNIY